MVKISLEEYLSKNEYLEEYSKKSMPILQDLSISDDIFSFLQAVNEHTGLYYINEEAYDSVVYSGRDNIYFCYNFNAATGRVTREILFILSSLKIDKTSDKVYSLTEVSSKEIFTVLLRD